MMDVESDWATMERRYRNESVRMPVAFVVSMIYTNEPRYRGQRDSVRNESSDCKGLVRSI